MALNKEEILRAIALGPSEEVKIPGLGKIWLRELSAKELSDFWKWWRIFSAQNAEQTPSDLDVACKIGHLVLVDKEGGQLFTEEEFTKAFSDGRSVASTQLAKAIFERVNATLSPESDEEAEKNSEGTGSVVRRIA